MIFVGASETWLPNPQHDALTAIPGVEIMALDVTDTTSVKELAGEIGGKVDIQGKVKPTLLPVPGL